MRSPEAKCHRELVSDTFPPSLSLSRLQEVLAETLEQLWISYNMIEKMKGVGVLKKLRVPLHVQQSGQGLGEFIKLTELTALEELNFVGNPLEEKHTGEGTWRTEVERKLTGLKKLDGLLPTWISMCFIHVQTIVI
ncbi:hypothetical protein C7M84_021902 [Penaeus vannamei]|uniref:Uncharacterized protein n=1 Tax=Penaeus vannamei TaxID=6689 RepID=A0A3R7MSM9_PENVA|nr:hypothetical protein C7M84_021902 [Penaeus vannamei]